jgi:hypothetical protein
MSELPQDDRKNPGIKRPYFELPEELPDGYRCVELQIPDGDEYHTQLVSLLEMLTKWYNWARDETHRGKMVADLWRDGLYLPDLGCYMNCEELTACLQPFFDGITEQLAEAIEKVDQLVEQANANAAKLPEELITEGDMSIYAGALALVRQMHKNNQRYYIEAEESLVDNASEATGIVLDLIPNAKGLPYGVALGIGNMYFENIAATYNLSYDEIEEPAACSLYRYIKNNDGELTVEIWGNWLNSLDTIIAGSPAASVFAAYSPLRQTFLNQIAALLNNEISLEEYFDELWQIYYAGTQSPVTVPGACGELEALVYNIYDRSVLKIVLPIMYGVPFDIEVNPAEWGSNEFYVVWGEYVDYEYTVVTGTYTGTIGEEPWSYLDEANTEVGGDPGDPATDLPTPGTARGIFMNAREDDSTTHVVRITLTAP